MPRHTASGKSLESRSPHHVHFADVNGMWMPVSAVATVRFWAFTPFRASIRYRPSQPQARQAPDKQSLLVKHRTIFLSECEELVRPQQPPGAPHFAQSKAGSSPKFHRLGSLCFLCVSNHRSWCSRARPFRRKAFSEFTDYVPTDSSGEAHGGIGEDQVRSPIRPGIVEIGQCS